MATKRLGRLVTVVALMEWTGLVAPTVATERVKERVGLTWGGGESQLPGSHFPGSTLAQCLPYRQAGECRRACP